MGRHCCVLGCNTAVYLPSHTFPKDASMMSKWRKAVYSKNIKDLSDEELRKYVVCYKHFADSDYEATYKLRRLKPGVIPSLCLNNDNDIKEPSNSINTSEANNSNNNNTAKENNKSDTNNCNNNMEANITVRTFEIKTISANTTNLIEDIEIIETTEEAQSSMKESNSAKLSESINILRTKASSIPAVNTLVTIIPTASKLAFKTIFANGPTIEPLTSSTSITKIPATKISIASSLITNSSSLIASVPITKTTIASCPISNTLASRIPIANSTTASTSISSFPITSAPIMSSSEMNSSITSSSGMSSPIVNSLINENFSQLKEKTLTCDMLDALEGKHFHKFTPKMWKLYKFSCVLRKKQEAVVKKQLSFRERIRQAKQYSKSPAIEKLLSSLTPVQRTFLEMQIKTTNYTPKDKHFTLDEKIAALSIMKQSSKCYQHLTQVFNLPDINTLRSILQKVNIHPGPIDFINQRLKKQVRFMKERDKVCLLMWDKMLLQPHLDYDATKKHILGFEDFGRKRSARFVDHVLVFMVRGIQSGWKLPLAYYFCDGATKTDQLVKWIKDISKIIIDSGLRLIAFMCNDGKRNLAAINKMKMESARLRAKQGQLSMYFYYGYITIKNQDIIPIYDPPHLIKSIRNNLLNNDLEFDCAKEEERKFASWTVIEQAYHMDLTSQVYRLMPKITAEHVIKNKLKKKKVKNAVEVLSRTMGAFIHHHTKLRGHVNTVYGPFKMPEKEGRDTAEIILFFDQLFDSVNGHALRTTASEKPLKVAISCNSPHFPFWKRAIKRLHKMRFVDSKNKKPLRNSAALRNWIFTIRGFRKLWMIIKPLEFKCLKPRMLNLDCLRHFFGQIRSFGVKNINPTCAEFENSFKTLLINNLTSPRPVGNDSTRKIDGSLLFTLKGFISKTKSNCNFKLIENLQLLELEIETNPLNKGSNYWNICDSIATKILNNSRIKGCDFCRNLLTNSTKYNEKFEISPSHKLLCEFQKADHILTQVMSNVCYSHHTALMLETELYTHMDFHWLNCQQHEVPLKELIVPYMVVFYIYKWCNGINDILIVKDQNND